MKNWAGITWLQKNTLIMENTHHAKETVKRTLVKTITYRVFIMMLDFTALYILTGQTKVAVGFMVLSNIYTTVGYFVHERVWDRIRWGKLIYRKEYPISNKE